MLVYIYTQQQIYLLKDSSVIAVANFSEST